ncbi:MAG: transposase family protein [Calditrichales bacterium]|nr:transposase family protein [Calditrichales bacterium]
MNKELQSLIEALALEKPPRSVASIYRQTLQIAQQKGWKYPTYRTFVNVIRDLDPGLVALAHEGSKAYRDNFDLIIRREATRSNEMWQADHSLLDIWLIDENGEAKRPWLSAALNDYSRAIPGYVLGFKHPDVLRTALMLRQAIWRKEDPRWHICGIPNVFYTDNGHPSFRGFLTDIQFVNQPPRFQTKPIFTARYKFETDIGNYEFVGKCKLL